VQCWTLFVVCFQICYNYITHDFYALKMLGKQCNELNRHLTAVRFLRGVWLWSKKNSLSIVEVCCPAQALSVKLCDPQIPKCLTMGASHVPIIIMTWYDLHNKPIALINFKPSNLKLQNAIMKVKALLIVNHPLEFWKNSDEYLRKHAPIQISYFNLFVDVNYVSCLDLLIFSKCLP
jgi:hypothetical protein